MGSARRGIKVGAGALITSLVLSLAPAAHAVNIGYEGCTPGYWKNHTANWEETTPTTLLGSIYTSAPASVSGLTLEEALATRGGSGADGAARILARAATAAWLNAAHEGVGYPWRRWQDGLDGRQALVDAVNAAFASGDRATMLALAAMLDADNNLGCPL